MNGDPNDSIELYWLPLGAGGRSVRINGKIFEALAAAVQRRPRFDLYHAGLIVRCEGVVYAIEQTPAGRPPHDARGVVAIGSVGARAAGRFRLFRYEVRRWRDGSIPDIDEAVGDPVRLDGGSGRSAAVLSAVESIPTPTWGRDELHAGEMWNSNSVIAWTLATAGLQPESISPPPGGRAPGWNAGWRVARRDR